MPNFSIYSPRSEPSEHVPAEPAADPSSLDEAEKLLEELRTAWEPAQRTAAAASDAGIRVLLRLPNLAARTLAKHDRASRFGEMCFWLVICVGALLAAWLIWQGGAAPAPPIDEAPTWPAGTSTQWQATPPALAPAFSKPVAARPASPPAAAITRVAEAPRADGVRRDGRSQVGPAHRPGEAMPTGRIITTPVQP